MTFLIRNGRAEMRADGSLFPDYTIVNPLPLDHHQRHPRPRDSCHDGDWEAKRASTKRAMERLVRGEGRVVVVTWRREGSWRR